MIKKLLLAVMLIIPAFGFAQKFAVINTQTIIEAMPEMATARTQLKASSDKFEENSASSRLLSKNAIAEYEKAEKDASTPQSIKDRRVQDIQEIQQKMEEFRNTASQDPPASAGTAHGSHPAEAYGCHQGRRCRR